MFNVRLSVQQSVHFILMYAVVRAFLNNVLSC